MEAAQKPQLVRWICEACAKGCLKYGWFYGVKLMGDIDLFYGAMNFVRQYRNERNVEKKFEVQSVKAKARVVEGRKVGWMSPYINRKAYGLIGSPFIKTKTAEIPNTKGLFFRDLCEHKIVLGGSGTGKTYSVLNYDLEELLRCTHLSPKDGRDEQKCFGMIIDPQGDFRARLWHLCMKYDRCDDAIYFGPDQKEGYDLFGDKTESPQQLANKFLEMLSAFSGGTKSSDPFWDNNARKLGMNIFLLHRKLELIEENVGSETKDTFAFPPMTFALLNLIMMDRGSPRNADAVFASQKATDTAIVAYEESLGAVVSILFQFLSVIEPLAPPKTKNGESPIPEVSPEITSFFQSVVVSFERIDGLKVAGELHSVVRSEIGESDPRKKLELLNKNGMLAYYLLKFLEAKTSTGVPKEFSSAVLLTKQALASFIAKREKLVKITPVAPEMGMLRRMLSSYEKYLEMAGTTFNDDLVWSYFNEEFLHVANEKTAGSVGMTATSMIALFAHPPFDSIFRKNATFTIGEVIDKGKILYMDIHTSRYGKAAEVALLAMKMDWFRTTLSRPDLDKIDASGNILYGKKVNQKRFGFYFCDEFGTVVTVGDTTGEAGYLDKVRKFDIACILGAQSLTVLYKRIPEVEAEAIFSNAAYKSFLRNTCIKTQEFASKMMGTEIKVSANMNQSATETFFSHDKPMGHEGFTTSYQKGAVYEPGDFGKLGKGEAIIMLPPKFAPDTVHRVQYAGHPVADPSGGKGPAVPGGFLAQAAQKQKEAIIDVTKKTDTEENEDEDEDDDSF